MAGGVEVAPTGGKAEERAWKVRERGGTWRASASGGCLQSIWPLGGENGGRTMKFPGEVESGRSLNWRLRDLRFPARWWSELEFEGLWRGLGRWRVPGCGGFGHHGVELVDFWIDG